MREADTSTNAVEVSACANQESERIARKLWGEFGLATKNAAENAAANAPAATAAAVAPDLAHARADAQTAQEALAFSCSHEGNAASAAAGAANAARMRLYLISRGIFPNKSIST